MHLGIFLERPVEEFVFPIGPARDAQDPERLLPAVHHHHPAIVDQRRLSRGTARILQFLGRPRLQLVEVNSGFVWLDLESEIQFGLVAARALAKRGHGV